MKSLSSRSWVLAALVLLALGIFFWREVRYSSQTILPNISSDIVITNGQVFFPNLGKPKYTLLTRLPDRAGQSTNISFATASIQKEAIDYLPPDPKFPYRLRNTLHPIEELARLDTAILLNNALIDTESSRPLAVPKHLRASAETESYLLQSAGRFDQVFDRETFSQLGVEKVAYIPHNTWIVRMKPATAERLKRFAGTQSVLPFEPYFKLSRPLLGWAAQQGDISGVLTLRLTLFCGAEEAVLASLKTMGMEYISEGRSPFGRTVSIKAPRSTLSTVASLDGVLTVESIAPRRMANDLTRVLLGADSSATNRMMNTNLHNLSGEGILVNLNDTGVDADHPGFSGERLIFGDSADPSDPSGHGTHVAGTIAGNGDESPVITNAFGSLTNANFHGMAPKASLYVLPVDLAAGPMISDEFLQEAAADYNYVDYVNLQGTTNNPLLSNNSWNYRNIQEYDSSAASYDAAVRDALPEKEGEQPILYVFSAGHTEGGNEQGRGGEADSISSPATAKNVITVGAIEALRYITNSVKTGTIDEITTNEDGITMTNQVDVEEQLFLPATDSSTEIASFSGRGNVGIGVEGAGGRFKPDVVAPGSFIISARSKDWQSSEQFLDRQVNTISNQTAISDEAIFDDLSSYAIFLRERTIEVEISIQTNIASPEVLPPLPIYAQFDGQATTNNLVGYTSVRLTDKESSPLRIAPESLPRWLYYRIGNTNDNPVSFDIQEVISVETENEEYRAELEKLNESLKPHYRFGSGTSTAAPAVTGLLALIQEFLRNNGLDNPSPALLKALLINGARTSGELYNFQVDPIINFQGWGLVNLDNSLPANLTNNLPFNSSSPQDFVGEESTLRFLDQHPINALATGEQKSWKLTLGETNQIRALPLRLSLVWTDPPGNPSAGIKLVNDLDLIVSNTVSGEILCGNNFTADSLFTQTTSADESLPLDNVNNVENVFISPPLDTNYVVSVVARRVNVNAVTDHPNDVVQDFALVVSVGDNMESEEPFQLEELEEDAEEQLEDVKYVETPSIIVITNGIPRLADRVGANAPLIGEINGLSHQWQFYVFTNSLSPPGTDDLGNGLGFTNGPNVAFVTFFPPNLARPRNFEADVDLYVSMDPGLTNLDANVISDAIAGNNDAGTGVSRGPGGTEAVILTNQNTGNDQVYYIGVKSEDHQGGEYAIVGISQDEPFEKLENGQRVLNGVPLNQGIIPDGSPNAPGAGLVLALGHTPLTIQRVTAGLSLVHDDIGDLLGNLSHNGVSVVLNNHALFGADGTATNLNVTYDDLREPVGLIQRSDGPGSLVNFIGGQGHGVWLMAQVDNALTHTGRVHDLTLRLTPSLLLEGTDIIETVPSNEFSYFVIDVPTDASALEVYLSNFDRSLDLYLRKGSLPTLTQFDKRALGTEDAISNGLRLRITRRDVPPLSPGQYFIGVYNPNRVSVQFRLRYMIERKLLIAAEQPFLPDNNELDKVITDDAVTYSPIFVPDNRVIADVKVGLRIDHSRASDLTMHLVSPVGTRILLSENRGGNDADGWGSGLMKTLTFGGFSDPDPAEIEEEELDPEKMIKFAALPYTEASVNINSYSFSGFEEAEPDAYTTGERFRANADGFWEVRSGTAIINDDGADEGTNYLRLDSGRVFASNLLVVLPESTVNRTLDLFYSARSSVDRGAPIGLISISNRVQVVDGSLEWRRNTPVRFLVPPNAEPMPIELISLPEQSTMQIDYIEIREPTPIKFFRSEESLSQFDGEPALGNWMLELWDNRSGPENTQPVLKTWQLLLSLAETNLPALSLNNGECVTNTVQDDEIQYYIVDVPRSTTFATNWLSSEGNLLLLLNEDGVPQGAGNDNLTTDFNGNGKGGAVLSLNGTVLYDSETNHIESLDTPMLHPGQRYYLGVKNADPTEKNGYELCIQFDQIDPQYPIITLTNAIPYTNTTSFIEPAQYYRYRAGTNVAELNIEVFPENGDVDAVAKLGLPLPNLVDFDKQSMNSGLEAELITFGNEDSATTIPSGSYYISVYNANANQTDVRYHIVATETVIPPHIIHPLTDGVPFPFKVGDNAVGENARVTNYFRLQFANPEVSSVQFDLSGLTGTADLILKKNDLPSMDDYDRIAVADPDRHSSGRIIVRTNATRPDLSGDWFAAVLNRGVADLNFAITGTTFTGDPVSIINLANRVWFTNTVVASIPSEIRERDYYRFVVASKAANVTFSLHPLVGDSVGKDLDLYLRRGPLPNLPSENTFDAVSARINSSAEVIRMSGGINADLPLEPGEWLLAVVNYERESVTYRIQAFQNLGLELNANFLSGCFDWDSIPGLRYQVQGKVFPEDPWDGLEEIIADSEKTEWCPSDPVRDVYQFFRAVEAEDPPDLGMFIETVKERGKDLAVEIELSEGKVCLSWNAELGETYTIEGKERLSEEEWTQIEVVLADAEKEEHCMEMPTVDYHFFRIRRGGELLPQQPPPGIVGFARLEGVRFSADQELCITWDSQSGMSYLLQGAENLDGAEWKDVEMILADGDMTTQCLSTGMQSMRFFRVAIFGTGPITRPQQVTLQAEILEDGEGVVLTWRADPSRQFQVEFTDEIPPNWISISVIISSDNGDFVFTDDGSMSDELGEQRYYRLREVE